MFDGKYGNLQIQFVFLFRLLRTFCAAYVCVYVTLVRDTISTTSPSFVCTPGNILDGCRTVALYFTHNGRGLYDADFCVIMYAW